MTTRTTNLAPAETWTERLAACRDRVLAAAQAGRHGPAVLAHATAGRMVATWTLDPAPIEPAAHLEAAHARGRRHLRRLGDQPPDTEVRSPMTGQLFERLTQPAHPAQQTGIDYRSVESYTYTPRKPLRRVLDHALDHLDQLDQWRRWRRDGVPPTPGDSWVPSTVTLPEDRLPLAPPDLDAWLRRIDGAMQLLVQRAAALEPDELDWRPPDGGWPLRRILHHVAGSELLYAASFDEALPADPVARYREADARLRERLDASRAVSGDPSIVFSDPYGRLYVPGEVVTEVLALEDELISRTA
jgi:DinB superfamily